VGTLCWSGKLLNKFRGCGVFDRREKEKGNKAPGEGSWLNPHKNLGGGSRKRRGKGGGAGAVGPYNLAKIRLGGSGVGKEGVASERAKNGWTSPCGSV